MAIDDTVTDLKSFVTFRLSRLQSRLNAQAFRMLRHHCDLSLTEWRVMAIVASLGGGTLSDLVRETELDKGQMSRGISSMVAKGYLKSQVSKRDQRQNLLQLTARGRTTHDRILPIMQNRQRELIAGVSEADLETTLRVITHLEEVSGRSEDV